MAENEGRRSPSVKAEAPAAAIAARGVAAAARRFTCFWPFSFSPLFTADVAALVQLPNLAPPERCRRGEDDGGVGGLAKWRHVVPPASLSLLVALAV